MKVLHLTMIVPFLLGGVIGEYTVRSGGAGDDEFCRGSPFWNQHQQLADCLGAHLRRSLFRDLELLIWRMASPAEKRTGRSMLLRPLPVRVAPGPGQASHAHLSDEEWSGAAHQPTHWVPGEENTAAVETIFHEPQRNDATPGIAPTNMEKDHYNGTLGES